MAAIRAALARKPLIPEIEPVSLRKPTDRAGIAALVMIVWGVLLQGALRSYPFSHAFHHDVNSPGLALQISRGAEDIDAVLHRSDAASVKAVASLGWNNGLDLIFIPIYTVFLWSLARVFTSRTRLLTVFLAGTALFDYLEDWRIFQALGGENPAIYLPSLAKWGLVGIVLIWIGVIFLRSKIPVYSVATRRLVGITYLISGLLTLIAVIDGQLIGYSLIELALVLFSVLAVIQVFGLLGHYLSIPGAMPKYVDDFCNRRKKAGQESLRAVERGIKHRSP
jgi:hypothetical protein